MCGEISYWLLVVCLLLKRKWINKPKADKKNYVNELFHLVLKVSFLVGLKAADSPIELKVNSLVELTVIYQVHRVVWGTNLRQ